ncbi:MAG: helix-hairpin-helix domain-containing protein [Candidatus Tectomicrobia bacterium]|uniref:Helix-hairpin-helix domain-containing protein n=1 Tax=Tectimicrobiota bacterium TaxID=2528274 RepID=A0A932M160_UNCTE|nr:helix-hairpin-helix domain-containing protein [Candidatus Tectomicrobia bacterium]
MSANPDRMASDLAAMTSIPRERILQLLYLWSEGYGNPFIARYRKEWTGGLGERELDELQELSVEQLDEEKRKEEFLIWARKEGIETPALSEFLQRASVWEIRALAPLLRPAFTSAAQNPGSGQPIGSLPETRQPQSTPGKNSQLPHPPGTDSWEQRAFSVVRDLDLFRALMDTACREGEFLLSKVEGASPLPARFSPWVGRSVPIDQVPAEAMLLGSLAEEQNLGYCTLNLPLAQLAIQIEEANPDLLQFGAGGRAASKILDSYLLEPLTQALKDNLLDRAQKAWIDLQCQAFQNLLTQTTGGRGRIAGIHPDFRSGCAVAVIDESGALCDQALLRPHESLKQREASRAYLAELIQRHEISLVAIGKAPAHRDMEALLAEAMALLGETARKPEQVVISEAGGVPSLEEDPDGVVSRNPNVAIALAVARRSQNPLAELVKADPVLLVNSGILPPAGVEKLRKKLTRILVSHVSAARIKLNKAPASLLRYVCGLDEASARRIVEHRKARGSFSSRMDLLEIPGFRGRIFEQAAGFLYLPDGENPLDRSAIHPESYFIVQDLCSRLHMSLETLLGRPEFLEYFEPEDFITQELKASTVADIFAELARLSRDEMDPDPLPGSKISHREPPSGRDEAVEAATDPLIREAQ